WLLPLLSREGARPYFEYLPYYPQERSYTRFLSEIDKGEVLTPSPLLNFAPEYVRVHFQIDANGEFSSPPAPNGNLRDLAKATCLPTSAIDAASGWLTRARRLVDVADLRARVRRAEQRGEAATGRLLAPHPLPPVQLEQAAHSQIRQSAD